MAELVDYFGQGLQIGKWAIWGGANGLVQGLITKLVLSPDLQIAKVYTRQFGQDQCLVDKESRYLTGKSLIQMNQPMPYLTELKYPATDHFSMPLFLDAICLYAPRKGQLVLASVASIAPDLVLKSSENVDGNNDFYFSPSRDKFVVLSGALWAVYQELYSQAAPVKHEELSN